MHVSDTGASTALPDGLSRPWAGAPLRRSSNGVITAHGKMERFCMLNGTWAPPGDCNVLGSIDQQALAVGLLVVVAVSVVSCALVMLFCGCMYAEEHRRAQPLAQQEWTEMQTASRSFRAPRKARKSSLRYTRFDEEAGAPDTAVGDEDVSETPRAAPGESDDDEETFLGIAGTGAPSMTTMELMAAGGAPQIGY